MLWSNLNKIFKYYYRSIIRQMISLFPNMNATKLFRWYYFKNLHFFSPSPSLNEGAPSQVDYRRLFFPAVFPNFQYLPPLDLDSPDATDISFGMASPINPSLLYFPPNPGHGITARPGRTHSNSLQTYAAFQYLLAAYWDNEPLIDLFCLELFFWEGFLYNTTWTREKKK